MKAFKKSVLVLMFLGLLAPVHVFAEEMKIAVVDLNKALNESEEGIRSKNILEGKGRKKQEEFKLEEEELRKLYEELRNNVLLTPETKKQKETELKTRENKLRNGVREFEQILRGDERKFTEEIFKELRSSIRAVSLEGKYDLVLEKTFAEAILYMKYEPTDITLKAIDYYNALKGGKKK